jgi:hypothetical protein
VEGPVEEQFGRTSWSVVLPVSKESTQSVILDLVQVLVLSRYLQPALLTRPAAVIVFPMHYSVKMHGFLGNTRCPE